MKIEAEGRIRNSCRTYYWKIRLDFWGQELLEDNPLTLNKKNQRFDFRDLNFDAENYVQLNDNYRVESDNELDVENLLENPDNFENKEIGENLNVENARPAKNLIVEPVENFNIVDNVENLTWEMDPRHTKLPSFSRKNPRVWVAAIEALFDLEGEVPDAQRFWEWHNVYQMNC